MVAIPRPQMSEHALQVAVAHMLQVVLDPERTWWSAIDHAAKLGVKINRKTGARYSPQGQSRQQRGVKRGMPDLMLMWCREPAEPGVFSGEKPGMIGIELKTDKGKLSPSQVEVMEGWRRIGSVSIYVARSLEEVQEILDFCNIPMRSRMTFLGGGDGRPTRAAAARHPRARRPRKSKAAVPVLLSRST